MSNKLLFFKAFVVLTMFTLVFTSCSKDNITKKSDTVKESSDEIRNTVPGGSDPTYLLDTESDEWCDNDGTNCASTVTITPNGSSSAYLKEFEIAIAEGSNGVSNYFKGDNCLKLFSSLESDPYQMLTKLQSGNYGLEKLIDPRNSNHIIYKANNIDNDDSFGLQLNIEK